MAYQSINPANGKVLKSYPAISDEALSQKLLEADRAFRAWRETPLLERVKPVTVLAKLLIDQKQELGTLMSLEMGKPIKQAIAEIEKCARLCEYYVKISPGFLEPKPRESSFKKSWLRYDPIGLIYGIMPWNFPFWQVFRYMIPNLILGNGVLLKHASNVPQCAESIEKLIKLAGFPSGIFQNLFIDYKQSARVIESKFVQGVTLTGSEAAGSKVAELAGKNLKKCVLELGGSDPFIVLKDADIEKAAQVAVMARMQNTGQSCIASKRFIVEENVYEQFLSKFKEAIQNLRVGDPLDQATDLGPLAATYLANELENQIIRSIEKGAKLELGGKRKAAGSNYFEPGILSNISEDCPAWHEEVFGPLALLFKVKNEEDAIKLANSVAFGLGASIWTKNTDHALELVAKIESGTVAINGMVISDPALPFGGIKKSGFGREMAEFGLTEFANIKTINLVG